MTKINRRDYLKGVGAVAGTIATASGLEVLGQDRRGIATLPDLAQQQPKDKFKVDTTKIYEQSGLRKYDLISSQSVKLIFSGLMAFFQEGTACVVGFHSKENGKHRHHLRIKVFQIDVNTDTCNLMGSEIQVTPGTPMKLEVIDPDVLNGVFYLNLPPLPDGSRHESDFRNVPDLEGPDWYKKDLTPQPDVYDPKLRIENGLFYTHKQTTSTFRRQTYNGKDVLEVGSVAHYIGTNIYLKPGGQVKLTVGAQVIPLPQAANVKYEIQFYNHCFNKLKGKDCDNEFFPYDLSDKTERNDFYMNYEALQNPLADEYLLIIAARGPRSSPDICGSPGRVTDEAPCAGVGFGGLGGFPSFP